MAVYRDDPSQAFFVLRDDPEKTAASKRGEFYITGDQDIADEDGFFWFVGRDEEVIISSR